MFVIDIYEITVRNLNSDLRKINGSTDNVYFCTAGRSLILFAVNHDYFIELIDIFLSRLAFDDAE